MRSTILSPPPTDAWSKAAKIYYPAFPLAWLQGVPSYTWHDLCSRRVRRVEGFLWGLFLVAEVGQPKYEGRRLTAIG